MLKQVQHDDLYGCAAVQVAGRSRRWTKQTRRRPGTMTTTLGTFAGRLLLVGCGNMAGAILDRWLAAGLDPAGVAVVDPAATPRDGVGVPDRTGGGSGKRWCVSVDLGGRR